MTQKVNMTFMVNSHGLKMQVLPAPEVSVGLEVLVQRINCLEVVAVVVLVLVVVVVVLVGIREGLI